MHDSEIAGIQANGWHSKTIPMVFTHSVGVANIIYFIATQLLMLYTSYIFTTYIRTFELMTIQPDSQEAKA